MICLPMVADAQLFDRDLQPGDSGMAVRELQKVLNKDTETQVALSGPGVPGSETEYFGPATKQAVIRFQEKYRTEILEPIKLTTGTGYVGRLTRLLLERLAEDLGTPVSTSTVVAQNTETTTVLFDAITELSPALTEKSFTVINEMPTASQGGLGCVISYTNQSSKSTTITGQAVARAQQKDGKWTLGELYLFNNFCQKGQLRNQKAGVVLHVTENGKQQKMVYLGPNRINLAFRSAEIWKSYFGGYYFRDPKRTGDAQIPRWPMMLFGRRLDEYTTLSSYNKLILSLEVTPRVVNSTQKNVKGTAPTGAVTTYSERNHAARFRMNLPVQWRSSACDTAAKRFAEPKLCAPYGRILWITLQLMDDRPNLAFRNEGETIFDEGSGEYIMQIDMREYIQNGKKLTTNPFFDVGKTTSLQGDVLPALKRAVLKAEAKGMAEGDEAKYIAPRLTVNGRKETDAEYLAHFGLNSINIGYETTGLSHLNYEISKYNLVGVKVQQ